MVERQWSTYQKAIFDEVAKGTGNVVVMARAGSGKTSTIVEALKFLPPDTKALLCAFNKRIQVELANRAPRGVDVKTLHSIGFSAVRLAWGQLILNDQKVDGIIHKLLPDARGPTIAAIKKLVGLAKNSLASKVDQVVDLAYQFGIESDEYVEEDLAKYALKVMERCLEKSSEIDFDDMIWLPVKLGMATSRYDIVFVDETQDLNACQLELAKKSCKPEGRIFAVGDDRQAIYRFRGADENAIGRMIKELNAKVLPLSICYRCGRKIIEMAKQVVPDIEVSENAYDGEIINVKTDAFLNTVMPQPKDFVLSRTNAPLMGVCLGLLRQGIPATVAGREVATALINLIGRSKTDTIPELVAWLERWRTREIEKLHARGKNGTMELAVNDKVETIEAISDGCAMVSEVVKRLNDIFSDQETNGKVVCSTVHKAKGLEAKRVFMLRETFRPGGSTEEDNIFYVAITRAQESLMIVSGGKEGFGAQKPRAPVERHGFAKDFESVSLF